MTNRREEKALHSSKIRVCPTSLLEKYFFEDFNLSAPITPKYPRLPGRGYQIFCSGWKFPLMDMAPVALNIKRTSIDSLKSKSE